MALNKVNMGRWCGICKNKPEKILYEYLKDIYKEYKIELQTRFSWCRKKLNLPYDFLINELKIIIELDGPQHFKQISNWQSPEIQQEIDTFKNNNAIENGYTLIRILQTDVCNNKNNWQEKLNNTIKNIINLN